MILIRILEHDLHRSRGGSPVPLYMTIPMNSECLPAVVSGTRGDFLIARKMWVGDDKRPTGSVAVGVFKCESDKLDNLIGSMIASAFQLSEGQSFKAVKRGKGGNAVKVSVAGSFKNSFSGKGAAERAFAYVQKSSGMKVQPHVCIVPASWTDKKVASFFGKDWDPVKRKFKRYCRVIMHDVPMPVFFSRPDMVGMYTQFLGGEASILLHNVELGMAFCPGA